MKMINWIVILLVICCIGCGHNSTTGPTGQTQVGDINNDGTTDQVDLDLLLGAFGSRQGDSSWNQNADLDNSGRVDGKDLYLLRINL